MFDKALKGSRGYWALLTVLLAVIVVGVIFYLQQLGYGLGITGMSRDVSWGLYICNMTFLVGIAASAVMVVLPFYLHNYKAFEQVTVLGEFLAVSAVTIAILFVLVDLGRPDRMFNVVLHPTPHSVLFWDFVVLFGYLVLNIVTGWVMLDSHHKHEPPPRWVMPLIILAIPWAVGIHTVTAFIYAGLASRPFWMTALMAPRFLAGAFASGPALLLILIFILKRHTRFDPGRQAIQMLVKIITYALIIVIFFWGAELFTVYYSQVPAGMQTYQYLLFGLNGQAQFVPLTWTMYGLALFALGLLLNRSTRNQEKYLIVASVAIFASIWIDKGLGLVTAGFIPSSIGVVFPYWPTVREALITLGVWAFGFFILAVLYKIAVSTTLEIEE